MVLKNVHHRRRWRDQDVFLSLVPIAVQLCLGARAPIAGKGIGVAGEIVDEGDRRSLALVARGPGASDVGLIQLCSARALTSGLALAAKEGEAKHAVMERAANEVNAVLMARIRSGFPISALDPVAELYGQTAWDFFVSRTDFKVS